MSSPLEGIPGLAVGDFPVPGDATLTDAEFAMIREGLGFTRAEIARLLEVSVQTVGHWESGKYSVPPGVGTELEELEGEWIDAVNTLVARLADSPISALTVSRDDAAGRPAGWWRSIAHQVTLRVPGLAVQYAQKE